MTSLAKNIICVTTYQRGLGLAVVLAIVDYIATYGFANLLYPRPADGIKPEPHCAFNFIYYFFHNFDPLFFIYSINLIVSLVKLHDN